MLYENNKLFENVDDLCNEIDDMRGLGKSIVLQMAALTYYTLGTFIF